MVLRLALLLCALRVVSAALGPIDTSAPSIPGGKVQNAAPPGPFFQDFKPPFPTTNWWIGYAAYPNQNSVVAGPFPYMSAALDTGFQFGLSNTRTFDGTSIIQTTNLDWLVSYAQNPNSHTSHKATAWDTQSVTIKYFSGSGAGFTTYVVPGSPYLTFNYNASTVLLTSTNGNIASINGISVGTSPVTVSGTKFTVINNAGTYVIYSLGGPISFSVTANALTGTSLFSGVIRIARVVSPTTSVDVLDQYSSAYPTGVGLDYTFSGDNATLSFTWNVVGNASSFIHLSWPHHRKALISPTYIAGLTYLSTKGYMKPVRGNVWRLSYALPTITWQAPRVPQNSCLSQLEQALEYEVAHATVAVPSDFYFWGKAVQSLARLALIADHIGRTDLIQPVISVLKQSYSQWLTPGTSNVCYAAYDTVWGGVVDGPGATNPNIDYGNGYYNDHHFHYGYFIYAASVIGRYDSTWWAANRALVTHFVRDIGNPSAQDPYYTVARCKDWFAGHSWGANLPARQWAACAEQFTASGIANGAGSRDQESSGEAVNGYYSLILYADLVGKQDLKNWARLLWATEVAAVQSYWHLYPTSNDPDTPYPEAGLRSLTTIGNVMDYQAGAWLFWGAQRSEIAAIQMLPVTPINEGLYDVPWLTGAWSYVSGEMVDPAVGDDWKSIIYMAYGEVSPQTAFARSTNITAWGGTTSQAGLLYHLATRKNPTGANICTASGGNPTGVFTIKGPNGKFVTSTGAVTQLIANAAANGTRFQFDYMPGGGSMLNLGTGMYVTADQNGAAPLSSARTVAQAWENFRITKQANGTYTMLAGVNSEYIVLDSTGALVNAGNNSANAAMFSLVPS
ncbi:unnamed protein product [Mycena citricolor]|uniref:glucan endo-1,3-beta-D-glucosidase n=1 Tax=Mycena citricolor TaxID=2018698 RepID=A0AAD2HUG3_9AGAR|nr:unnamed protein product [Mycena citricolor]